MFSTAVSSVLLAAVSGFAAPTTRSPLKRAANDTMPTDTQVLQYALTLERLEATFYADALKLFSAKDFTDAGVPSWVRGRVSEIAAHETTHVNFLSAALANDSVEACTYKFPYNDVRTFLVFACGLENIGVSAYLGAAQYIKDPGYLSAAASITTVEARHQSFFNSAVLHGQPWTGPFDTPLGLDMVYTLASQLIVSCPSSNPMLPVMAAANLTVMGSPIFDAAAGSTIQLMYPGVQSQTATTYAAVYNGLGQAVYPITNGSVTLPTKIQGYSYILVTTASDWPSVTASNIIAGPAEIQTAFNSNKANPGFINPFGV